MRDDLYSFLDAVDFRGNLNLDGTVQRYARGHSRKKDAWVWSIEKGGKIFAVAGDWKTGERVQFGSKTIEIREALRQRKSDANDRAAVAAERAARVWAGALHDEGFSAEYLDRKRVETFGIGLRGKNLVVPMRRGGELIGLQTIRPDGKKLFTSGCKKLGASHYIHGLGKVAVLCEGYATGASIYMATRFPVLIAFDCGNLLPAARAFTGDVKLWIVAADNDQKTPGNPGLTKALEASRELRGRVAMPVTSGTDFNDMHLEHGLESVADAIYECL